MITKMLQRGIANGEFRDINTEQLNHVLVAPVVMLMMWKHSFGPCQNVVMSSQEYLNSFKIKKAG